MQLTGHITEDEVMALYLGSLPSEEQQRFHLHVADCTGCSREYELYREILSGVETLVQGMAGTYDEELLRTSIRRKMRTRQLYYDLMHHPLVGPLWLAASHAGLCLVEFADRTPFEIEERLKVLQPDAWITLNKSLTSKVIAELRAYFNQELSKFSCAIDWRLVPEGFTRSVLEVVSRIPYGHVFTYGDIADRIGKPKSVRAVGGALGANPIPIVVPCHRVVAKGGKLGGFSAGLHLKRKLLELEGVRWPNFSRQMDFFSRR